MNQESARTLSPVNHATEHSVGAALEHVIVASQRVITDRLDLLRLEVSESVGHGLRGVLLISAGVLVSCCAWLALTGAMLAILTNYLSLPVCLLIVATLHAGAGSILIAGGVRDTREPIAPAQRG
jgi:hypothetical protein